MFPRLPARATFVVFCPVRDTKNVSDFVQKHFVSAANVSQFAQPKKHHGQQCVRNNVSSFTRTFRVHTTLLASMCHAEPFSARALKKNIFFDVDIVTKNKSKCGLSWSVLLPTTSTCHYSFPKHFFVLFLHIKRVCKSCF